MTEYSKSERSLGWVFWVVAASALSLLGWQGVHYGNVMLFIVAILVIGGLTAFAFQKLDATAAKPDEPAGE